MIHQPLFLSTLITSECNPLQGWDSPSLSPQGSAHHAETLLGAGLAVVPLHLSCAALFVHVLHCNHLFAAAGGNTSFSFHWLSSRPKVQYSSKGVTYSCWSLTLSSS